MVQSKLDVLIPTYNRSSYLEKNLFLISSILKTIGQTEKVRLVISDNNSSDQTKRIVENFIKNEDLIEVVFNVNPINLGLEKNISKTLELSLSDYVMFLGDDDFLSIDYWNGVMSIINQQKPIGVIIPERQTIQQGESIEICLELTEEALFKEYSPSWLSCWLLSSDCNQLSGIVYNRSLLMEKLTQQACKTLYPFMSFAGWCAKVYHSYKFTNCPVLITEGAKKDWGYGDDGLLGDILVNSQYIAEQNLLQRALGELFLLWQWRDRLAMN